MGLSGFIKQLLETDSVFGSEAKKLTGINDRTNNSLVRVFTKDILGTSVDISPIEPNNIVFTFNNTPDASIFVSDDFVPNVLLRLRMDGIDYSDKTKFIEVEKYNNRLFKVNSIDNNTPNTFIVIVTIEPEDDQFFDELSAVQNIKIDDVVFDPRIASIINNPIISQQSENGSTMFNIDNTSPGDELEGPSGIARKYAAHYHGNKQINITSHSRDERNNPLIRYTIDTKYISGQSFQFSFLEDVVRDYIVFRQFNELIQRGTAPDVKVVYDTGSVSATVAEYGDLGSIGFGEFKLNSYPTAAVGPPVTIRPTSVSLLIPGEPITFSFELADGDIDDSHKRWPEPPVGERTVSGAMRTLLDTLNFWAGYNGQLITERFRFVLKDSNTITVIGAAGVRNNILLQAQPGQLAPSDQITKEDITGATDPVPSTGIKFVTQAELLNVLKTNTDTRFNIDAVGISDRISLSTDVDPSKNVLFGDPSPPATDDVWKDSANNNLNFGIVSSSTLIQITQNNPAEIIFDSKGDVVYSKDLPDND